MNDQTISDQTWAGIREEFTLPTLEQVRRRLSELMEDPEPVMRQLVRVFIDDGTFCPGFQFLPGGQLRPQVIELFGRALELDIPHNYFTLWMVTPRPGPCRSTPRRPPERRPRSPASGAGILPLALALALDRAAGVGSVGPWDSSTTTPTSRP